MTVVTHRYTLPVAPAGAEVAAATLWAAGAIGVWERPGEVVGWFPDTDRAVPAGGTWTVEPARDWQAEWKATIAPVRAGRVVIVPSWLVDEHRAGPGDVTIVLDPGQAFGTGHHATTTMCLELLQEIDVTSATAVADVGTGTGVLGLAALALGAGTAVGVDLDPEAVAVARSNAARLGLPLDVRAGSVEALDESADVVLANLVTDTVAALATRLVTACRPGGTLIVSGIAAEREAVALDALALAGARIVTTRHRDGWTAARAAVAGAA